MAEVEAGENGDQGRVRQWLTRALSAPRDPVWTADGQVFEQWRPISPISGRLDAFEWKVIADRLPPRATFEIEADQAGLSPETPVEVVPQPPASSAAPVPVEPAPPLASRIIPAGEIVPPGLAPKGPRPMARAPDDPGPQAGDDEDDGPVLPLFHRGHTA
jgi:HemY protein